MWPAGRLTSRRKEIRRAKVERRTPWVRRVVASLGAPSLALAAVSAITATIILNTGVPLGLQVGQTVPRAITSRIAFEVVDEQQTRAMRLQARDNAPNFFRIDAALFEDIRGRLNNALTLARANIEQPERLREEAAGNKIFLDDAGVEELRRLAAQPENEDYPRAVDQVMRVLASKPLVDATDVGTRRVAAEAVLFDSIRSQQRTVPAASLVFSNNPDVLALVTAEAARAMPDPLRATVQASLAEMLRFDEGGQSLRPLYRYDSNRSIEAAERAFHAVPTQFIRYAERDVLADAGVLSAAELALIRLEQDAFLAVRAARPFAASDLLPWLGRGLLAVFVVFGLALHVVLYRGEVYTRPLRQASIILVILSILALTRALYVSADVPPHLAVGMQALAAGLMGIVYAHGAVFAISAALAVLMTLVTDQSVSFLVILLAVSGIQVFGLRDVRYRGRIVTIGALAAAVTFVATIAAGLLDGQTLAFLLGQSLWAFGSTLMAAFILEGILPGIERLFRLSTSMTLLEWCDASKPLLRHMAADAPGTYNHSLLVGALAEAAAEAIGADGLLARTGAYYHDVGKINKPEYFAENQTPGISRHDRLSPAMSLLIIIGHVKDGIEMAKEYGLPVSLHPFIAEHHGTTIVEYFYHAATKARKPGDPEVSEASFRYPGPKPQSREAAVVMLCDGVEGAVRAMAEPTPGRIESVVEEIAHRRLMDGQFDDCDLTFRELSQIQRSLVKTLAGIYHARIEYPEREDERRMPESRSAS